MQRLSLGGIVWLCVCILCFSSILMPADASGAQSTLQDDSVIAKVLCGKFAKGGSNQPVFPPLPPPGSGGNFNGNRFNSLSSSSAGGYGDRVSSGNRFAGINGNNMYQMNNGRGEDSSFTRHRTGAGNLFDNDNNRSANNRVSIATDSNNLEWANDAMIQKRFATVNDWYDDWYSRFYPVYTRLTNNASGTPRALAAANYASGVRMNFVENTRANLSRGGSAPHLFMKNLESRLNALGTNFPAEWTQVTCGTGFFFHSCGSLIK